MASAYQCQLVAELASNEDRRGKIAGIAGRISSIVEKIGKRVQVTFSMPRPSLAGAEIEEVDGRSAHVIACQPIWDNIFLRLAIHDQNSIRAF